MFDFETLRKLQILFKKKRGNHYLGSEAKYRDIVENSIVGVYIIQDEYFRYVNKKFCEIFGYTYEEIATKLGISVNVVEHNVSAALKIFRRHMRGFMK